MSDETRCPECGTKQTMPPAVRAVCEEMRKCKRTYGEVVAFDAESWPYILQDEGHRKAITFMANMVLNDEWLKRIEEAYE